MRWERSVKTFWRISSYIDLEGQGGLIGSARWHTRGRPIVYLSESPASALLERIVHLQDGSGRLPRSYTLLRIEAPEDAAIKDLLPLTPEGWKDDLRLTRRLGDEWLASQETAIARAPSVIAPRTWNYLLNPEHTEAKKVRIVEVIRERFDDRLFRFESR